MMTSLANNLIGLSEDNTTILTPATPPESTVEFDDLSTTTANIAVPWPGRVFILRTIPSNRILTLRDGQVVLSKPTPNYHTCKSNHWSCIENKGWLGFRNVVSGKFLGHDWNGRIVCVADWHKKFERFDVRHRPQEKGCPGGYVLMLTHRDCLWHIDLREEGGAERLAKYGEGCAEGLSWEFIEVSEDR